MFRHALETASQNLTTYSLLTLMLAVIALNIMLNGTGPTAYLAAAAVVAIAATVPFHLRAWNEQGQNPERRSTPARTALQASAVVAAVTAGPVIDILKYSGKAGQERRSWDTGALWRNTGLAWLTIAIFCILFD